MRIIFLFVFYFTSIDVFAQDCHFIFFDGKKSVNQKAIEFLARRRTGQRSASRNNFTSPVESVQKIEKREKLVNPYMNAFLRMTSGSLSIDFEPKLDWIKVRMGSSNFVETIGMFGSKVFTYQSHQGVGHRVTLSKAAAMYLSVFRDAINARGDDKDARLADWVRSSVSFNPAPKKQMDLLLTLFNLKSNVENYMPESLGRIENYSLRRASIDPLITDRDIMKSGERQADETVAAFGGIDALAAILGRERLFSIYFDVLADAKARGNGERFDSPNLRIFSEEQLAEIARNPRIKAIVRSYSVDENQLPNFEIVIALGLKYLNSDLSPVSKRAIRDYVYGIEAAKDFLPDSIFDSFVNSGYALSDFKSIMRLLFTYQALDLNRGYLTFSTKHRLEDQANKYVDQSISSLIVR